LEIEAGTPLNAIQEQLGHHSPTFTAEQYGHVIKRMQKEAVMVIGGILSEAVNSNVITNRKGQKVRKGEDFPSIVSFHAFVYMFLERLHKVKSGFLLPFLFSIFSICNHFFQVYIIYTEKGSITRHWMSPLPGFCFRKKP